MEIIKGALLAIRLYFAHVCPKGKFFLGASHHWHCTLYQTQELHKILPKQKHCHILMTSRNWKSSSDKPKEKTLFFWPIFVLILNLSAYTHFLGHDEFGAGLIYTKSCFQEAFWCLVQISEQYLPGYYSSLLVSTHLFTHLQFTRAGRFSLEGVGWFVARFCQT